MSITCKTNPNFYPMPIDLNSTHGYIDVWPKISTVVNGDD